LESQGDPLGVFSLAAKNSPIHNRANPGYLPPNCTEYYSQN